MQSICINLLFIHQVTTYVEIIYALSLIGFILCFIYIMYQLIYRLCIKLYSIKGTFKICVVWILNVLMEKSTYTIHLYKYKNTRIGLCVIFLLSFFFTKVLYVQTIARDGGTYCITIIIFHVSLFSTRPVNVLGPCMCRLWPMAEPIHAK